MKGYVTQQSGRWYAVVDARPTGKRTFHRADDEKAAHKLLARLLDQLDAGTYVAPTKITLSEYAYGFLIDAKPNLAPKTYEQYEYFLRRHICPKLGTTRLTDLHPKAIQSALTAMHADLAPKSVHHAYTTLRRVLNQAVQYGMLRENPVSRVDAPNVPKRELTTWTPEQAAHFLDSPTVKRDRLFAVYYLALATGMRRGEILGLKWADIDFSRMRMTVQRSLTPDPDDGGRGRLGETKGGWQRAVAMSPATADVLAAHRAWQEVEAPPNPLGLVFVSKHGNPVHTSSLDKQHKLRVRKAGLPAITFHDLRHCHATFLLAAGYHHKVVQERLGHRNIATTLGIYTHVGADLQREAAATTDDLLKPRK